MAVKDTNWGQSAQEAIRKGWEVAGQYQDNYPDTTGSIRRWFLDYQDWLSGDGMDELPPDPFPSSYPHDRAEWLECQSILRAVYHSANAVRSSRPAQVPGWFQEFYESLVQLVAIVDDGTYWARNPDFCAQAPRGTGSVHQNNPKD